MNLGAWLALCATFGCAGVVIGDVLCARRNHVGPWWDDDSLDEMGRTLEGRRR